MRGAIVRNVAAEKCDACGLKYTAVKTGLNFTSVRAMMYVDSLDVKDWKPKGRKSVLGFWHQLKRGLWAEHLAACQAAHDAPAEEGAGA